MLRLILPRREISVYTLLQAPLRRLRGRLDVCAEVGSMELMRTLTMDLNAISFQSRFGLDADLAPGRLVHKPLAGPGTRHTAFGAFLRIGRSLPIAVEMFMGRGRDDIARRAARDGAA